MTPIMNFALETFSILMEKRPTSSNKQFKKKMVEAKIYFCGHIDTLHIGLEVVNK